MLLTAWHSACHDVGKMQAERRRVRDASPAAWAQTLREGTIPKSARRAVGAALADFGADAQSAETATVLRSAPVETLAREGEAIEAIAHSRASPCTEDDTTRMVCKGMWLQRAGILEVAEPESPERDRAIVEASERGWSEEMWSDAVRRGAGTTYLAACKRLEHPDALGARAHIERLGRGHTMVWAGAIEQGPLATLVALAHLAHGHGLTKRERERRANDGFGIDPEQGLALWEAWVTSWDERGESAEIGRERLEAAARWWGAEDPKEQAQAFTRWAGESPAWTGQCATHVTYAVHGEEAEECGSTQRMEHINAVMLGRMRHLAGARAMGEETASGLLGECVREERDGAEECARAMMRAHEQILTSGDADAGYHADVLVHESMDRTWRWGEDEDEDPGDVDAMWEALHDEDDGLSAEEIGLPEEGEAWLESAQAPASAEEAAGRILEGVYWERDGATERAIDAARERWPEDVALAGLEAEGAGIAGLWERARRALEEAEALAGDAVGAVAVHHAALEGIIREEGRWEEEARKRLRAHGVDIALAPTLSDTTQAYRARLEGTPAEACTAKQWAQWAFEARASESTDEARALWRTCLDKARGHAQADAGTLARCAWKMAEGDGYQGARDALDAAATLVQGGKGSREDIAHGRLAMIKEELKEIEEDSEERLGPDQALSLLARDLRYGWNEMERVMAEWRRHLRGKSKLNRRMRLPRRPLRLSSATRRVLGKKCAEEIERSFQMRKADEESTHIGRRTWLRIVQLHSERRKLREMTGEKSR